MGYSVSDVFQSTTSSPSLPVVQVGTPQKILDQWGSNIYNRIVLNMVKSHNLWVTCNQLIFHNFKWFNIKTAMIHHPVIQKEADELLTKGATEPLVVVLAFTQMCMWFLSAPSGL